MGFKSWVSGFFNEEQRTLNLTDTVWCSIPSEKLKELSIKKWAIDSCANKIANTLSCAEVLTYEKGEEVRKKNWYMFNVEANQNQNATEFWKKAIYKLVYDNEALIFMQDEYIYVADSFTKNDKSLYENTYTEVTLKDLTLKKEFKESEVLHLTLNNESIKSIIDGFYLLYGDLLTAAVNKYKKLNSRKIIVKLKAMFGQTPEAEEKLRLMLSERMKKFLAEGDSALPVEDGMEIDELAGDSKIAESRDIKKMIDDVFEMVANSFNIPLGLAKGDTVGLSEQVNSFLMFSINPIAEMFTDEGNRKFYGRDSVLERTYMKLDTTRIKVQDIQEIASSMDVLFHIGVNTIDDNLRMIGREPVMSPETQERFVTKNYAPLGENEEDLKGGDINENKGDS
ncbi:TPA: phage portal protein [Listeria monocytogenes]|uniref:Portal protein n=10 Tax=root TaxID=1 RepID=Q8W606_9CAUD|nr:MULTISPECIES: phage portal protein [Listeria]NP_510984.1 portal protein [Listeria phage PSA]MCZ18984.1 phage portal protein [Listeria monocytogenes serotype 4b]ALD11174.1 phage portal protein [Listeria monocytogenes J1-220]APH79230.2 Phage portal (connector) protein [Listeria monocytogenes]AQY44477.1 phage portal protein [Listeria monocytogenes]EAA0169368.1 phage portal protein [Listeria monocytogenes]